MYRGPRYTISNWSFYHLHAPRRGYYWVRIGDEFLLISRRTGNIIEIVEAR
jgi:Ni/Co efflux regulator RcnB